MIVKVLTVFCGLFAMGLIECPSRTAESSINQAPFPCPPYMWSHNQSRVDGSEFFLGNFLYEPRVTPEINFTGLLTILGVTQELLNVSWTLDFTRVRDADVAKNQPALYKMLNRQKLPEREIIFDPDFELGARNNTVYEGKTFEYVVNIQHCNTLTMNYGMADFGFGHERYFFDDEGVTALFDQPNNTKSHIRFKRLEA